MRASFALPVAIAIGLAAPRAHAQVSLSTEVSARKIQVGDRLIVRLRAMSSGGEQVSDPQLKLPPGISGSGPSVSSQSQMSILNGQMTQSVGITATWALSASQPGSYKLGPASVLTAAGRKQDRAVTIEVVPQGALPQNPPPLGGQPLDPFGMLRGFGGPGFPGFPGFSDLDQPPEQPQLPLLPEEYRIEQPLDPIAFLRGRAVPKKAVVGEQVTLSVYAYAGRGNFQPGLIGEPSRDDFLAFNLTDDGRQLQGYQFDLNGQRWIAVKVQTFALFPLKAGSLKAGEMSFAFVGRGYSNDPQGLKRVAAPVEINVVEPPLKGRPPGYKLGDVGHYGLTAQVEPREVPAGGSISVVARLEGTGNVPFSLQIPEQTGVRFLEPQLVEQVAPRSGVVQGFRSFTYVVELNQPGEVDLGELTLPYWDPKAKAYDVARAALGKVKVTGSAPVAKTATGSAESSGQRLKGLIVPPAKLGPAAASQRSALTNFASYWLALLGLPCATLLGFALSDLTKLLRRRLTERRGSLATATDEALAQLSSAGLLADAATLAGAAERALFLSIEKATDLKARGLLKSDLGRALRVAGVPDDLAVQTADLLAHCDELRFAGEGAELRAFAAETRSACQKLLALKRKQPEPSAP